MSTQNMPELRDPPVAPALLSAPYRGLRRYARWRGTGLAPGLLLTASIAALAFLLRSLSGIAALSPLMLAIVIGIIIRNTIGTPFSYQPGILFSMRRILRFAIILLGVQLSLSQMMSVGIAGLLIIAVTLGATFLFTLWLGRRLGIDSKLVQLIAAGTSICGASAIVATNTVTRAADEDVAYAVACVTVFGSASMLVYPWLASLLHLAAQDYGLWAGASIHEIAQVIAAAFQGGTDAGEFATIAKLSRVMLLAPTIFVLGYIAARRFQATADENRETARRATPVPWFVVGFIGMMLANSLDLVPAAARADLGQDTSFLLSVALAAMGLETDLRKVTAKGWKPLLLGAASWVFIAAFSLALIEFAPI
jgi:uncharacterized integral membrane protein (TIGR00698 family)